MALYVNTNVSSINAQRKLANSTLALNTSYQRLSSGLRINSSKDDAAGLQISDRLTAQINGLNQGNRNANDGIALAQTIEGALDETTNMLQRIRTLAVQAANGTNTAKDRQALQEEVKSLSHEITRIAQKTTFAGATVLDGGKAPNNLMREVAGQQGAAAKKYEYFFQVGANSKDEITLECGAFTMEGIMSMANVGKTGKDVMKFADNEAKAGEADSFGMALTAQNGPKTNAYWVVSTPSAAQNTLKFIDSFIETVDSKRAALGAIQNRMESTIRNQSSISENESDARSRIRDTDFASETAALTQNQIIQQASQTILTQANQRPTVALNLLGGR
ncbi:MAG: flagellin [Anaerobiospirillum succiniciproducens]|uniref:flagellin N-terminal helical domain-containing protein n=1 Tax=Anaerobiospirillum succiniciproducens TaxID=13335 RepID=UPI0026DB4590|nr:flagellin [Anaerobiospirillum succiniciproducens]MDO4676741.1 flagellin [Anaerobiospirillum succiniciproducens]